MMNEERLQRLEHRLSLGIWNLESRIRRRVIGGLRRLQAASFAIQGVPKLPERSHSDLRGALKGRTVLIHGNGLSAPAGLEYVREVIGDDLVTFGMNASPMHQVPDFYFVIDPWAIMLYREYLEMPGVRIFVAPHALKLITRSRRLREPALYDTIVRLCQREGTYRIAFDETVFLDQFPRFRYYWPLSSLVTGPTVGTVALMVALWMMSTRGVEDSDSVAALRGEGRIVLTGIDGYDCTMRDHIDPEARGPGQMKDRVLINLAQSSVLSQAFYFADQMGIEIWNLSRPDVLPVNRAHRHPPFDLKIGNQRNCRVPQ